MMWLLVLAAAVAPFRNSMSVSPFSEVMFRGGFTFTDGKLTATNVEELQRLFAAHGANEVYARIATTRKHRVGVGDHSMERGLERARMAAALKLPFNPELGLFNVYGDIRCQPPPDFSDYPEIKLPGEWNTLKLDQMLPVLRTYGATVAREIVATGVEVRIWDIGNEVELGVAGVAVRPMPGGCDDTAGGAGWYRAPDAVSPVIGKMSFQQLMRMPTSKRVAWLEANVWPYEAKMLAAVAEGIRTVDAKARFSTHISGVSAVIPDQAAAFYQAMTKGGFSPDELGISYYPTSSAVPADRLQAFKDTAMAMHRALDRPVFIAEFGYPAAKLTAGFVWNDAVPGYAQTPDGQANFLRDLTEWGTRTGVLSGIRLWGPDLAGPGWGPMSLFSSQNKVASARPALDSVAEAQMGNKSK